MMNDLSMGNFRPQTPSTAKRNRIDTNMCFNQNDLSTLQSQNTFNRTSDGWRRSSISYFADESPGAITKVDHSFDKNEIFRPENVLNVRKQDDSPGTHNFNRSFNQGFTNSSKIFPFSDFRKRANVSSSIVSESEDDSSKSGSSLYNLVPPLVSGTNSVNHQQYYGQGNQKQHYGFHQQQYGRQQLQPQQCNQYMIEPNVMPTNPLKRSNDEFSQQPQRPTKARFRSHQAESWMEKYEELLDFRLGNGHCLVPNQFPENPPLAEWVKRQRYQYKLKRLGKHSSMSDDRVTALEKLGFVWNSHDAVWEERLKELKHYKSMFGTTNVPSKYEANPQLAIWIKRQRRQYKFLVEGKPSTMTPYRVQKLREIDFAWSGRRPRAPAA